MKKLVHALALCGLASLSASAIAGPHSFTGNVGLFSDYAFRGVSQTDAEPALQGGFDYAHDSGIYLGTWASNVDPAFLNGANLEWDFYGGYNGKVNDDLSYNVGLLQYYYPGQTGAVDIDTTELYAGVTYKWFGLKASYSLDDYFGVTNSDGTVYWDASFNYELPAKVMLSAHYGWTRGEGAQADYDDWKIGLAKEFGGFNFGLAYIDTDTNAPSPKPGSTEDLADSRLVASVSKSF